MKKILFVLVTLFGFTSTWAAPNLVFKPFKKNNVLATIKLTKGMNSFFKMDLYFFINDDKHEFSSHSEMTGAYHPFFDKSYIANEPSSSPIGNIVKAEARLIIQTCTSKEANSCSVIREEYLNLEILDNDIQAITPNQIEVTL